MAVKVVHIITSAALALGAAVAIALAVIAGYEFVIAVGWADPYDDATMALCLEIFLIAAPIFGGWRGWVRLNEKEAVNE